MSYDELAEHSGYVKDAVKVAAYREALKRAISPGDVVIDLGSGSGLLGSLALEAGAARVIAVDSGAISLLATEVFTANGNADRVDVRRCNSRLLELDAPADVVVCDQIGGFAHEVGLTGVVKDLFDRGVLKPDARVVPSCFDLLVAPVSAPPPADPVEPWVSNTTGLDFTPFVTSAQNTPFRLTATEDWLLGDGVHAAQLDAKDTSTIAFEVECQIESDGVLTGILGYMRAHLDERDGVVLTNDPADPGRFNRWHLYHPVPDPFKVSAGDVVRTAFEINQLGELTNWNVTVGDQTRSASTFLGRFMDPKEFFAPKQELPPLNASGRCRTAVMDAIHNGAGFNEIVMMMTSDFPQLFPTEECARRELRSVVASYCE